MVLIGDNFLQTMRIIWNKHNLKIDARKGGEMIIFHHLPSNQSFVITFTLKIMCQTTWDSKADIS